MGDGGIEILGGVTTYSGTGKPTYTIADNAVTIMENFASGAAPNYVGTVLYFNTCIDASAFAGIQFDLSGSTTGCTIQYSANDAPHDDMGTDAKGACTLGSDVLLAAGRNRRSDVDCHDDHAALDHHGGRQSPPRCSIRSS